MTTAAPTIHNEAMNALTRAAAMATPSEWERLSDELHRLWLIEDDPETKELLNYEQALAAVAGRYVDCYRRVTA